MNSKKIAILAILPIFSLLSGCASIVSGTNQPVSVETTPENATCSLANNDGKWYISNTPGSVTVHRSYQDLDVKCQKQGYLPAEEKVKSHTKAMAAGNILFGGLIGVGVDAASGAAYDYPNDIKINMIQIKPLTQMKASDQERIKQSNSND